MDYFGDKPLLKGRERRRESRRAMRLRAWADPGGIAPVVDCVIVDISEGGARLRPLMCAPDDVPDRFTLLLSSCGRVRRACHVAWRSESDVGVQFRAGE